MAHLAALETRSDRLKCKEQKLALVRKLYEQGFKQEELINLLAFIDWMWTLQSEIRKRISMINEMPHDNTLFA